ncbi:hypothetical protein J7T55_010493 [Diaporthe amygdali]|uniref:uncharacterized protein n=1 Tax=Phomopsis amygdali TaxID=1214568 RepID=UPI0022FDC273|nr:uncharacterized protein J7T55_010493 [Diaporthe amygdali]KAJ0115670.1 hypothetical protein J7T55_010493 [Diaporthe amygdali]
MGHTYRSGTSVLELSRHILKSHSVLICRTNFVDVAPELGENNTYFVRAVVDGNEGSDSGSYTLAADNDAEPVVRIALKSGGTIKSVWVGDLDGDGEYDYVIDRQTSSQSIEAYKSDGTFLWEVNLGPNSENQNNIEPGSSTIDVGHWDGVTVYDLDSDGKAEVAVRIANGVVFGDGEEFTAGEDDNHQFIAILDGETGVLRATSEVPDDYISDGPLDARFGVGYLDGETPHLVAFLKNRQDGGAFNLIEAAWTFDGVKAELAWKWLRGDTDEADGHNTRIIDVDGDGVDEVAEIGFLLEGNGTLRYSLADSGIYHGDRWYIAKMDPGRDGLQGYGIQQDNEDLLYEYYYDATDGSVLWKHYGDEVGDVGRGIAGDIDPNYEGMEVWSFPGIYNAPSNKRTDNDTDSAPWPGQTLWWNGDILSEQYNDGKIEEWDYETGSVVRIESAWHYGASTSNKYPLLIADIFGDWREEMVLTNSDNDELLIFTTNIPSDIRLYTLAHNPAYRNDMTVKGYIQSHHVDYFLGEGMEAPPKPEIYYVGA